MAEYFVNEETRMWTIGFWLRNILAKRAGELVSMVANEEIVLNLAMGRSLVANGELDAAGKFAAGPLRPYEYFEGHELIPGLLPHGLGIENLKQAIYKQVKPFVADNFQVYSPGWSYAYTLAPDPDLNWRNGIGAFSMTNLTQLLIAAKGRKLRDFQICSQLRLLMEEKYQRLVTVFGSSSYSPLSYPSSENDLKSLICELRARLIEYNAPWRIPVNRMYHGGYSIVPR